MHFINIDTKLLIITKKKNFLIPIDLKYLLNIKLTNKKLIVI